LERQYVDGLAALLIAVRGLLQLAGGSSSAARRKRITGSIISNRAVDRPRKSGVQ